MGVTPAYSYDENSEKNVREKVKHEFLMILMRLKHQASERSNASYSLIRNHLCEREVGPLQGEL